MNKKKHDKRAEGRKLPKAMYCQNRKSMTSELHIVKLRSIHQNTGLRLGT